MVNRLDDVSPDLSHVLIGQKKETINQVHEQYLKLQDFFEHQSGEEGAETFTPYEI